VEVNFLQYFQIQAAAKQNIPFLLSLDLLLANARIDRQESTDRKRAEERSRQFESSVECAHAELTSGSAGQSADATTGQI